MRALSLCVFASFLMFAAPAQAAQVDSAVFQRLSLGAEADILVRFPEAPPLPQPSPLLSKADRGRLVYDQLRRHAQSSQARLLALLRKRGVEHRSYYLENLVQIPAAGLELVKELSVLSGVIEISENPRFRIREELPSRFHVSAGNDVPENIKAVGADKVWTEFRARGEGIVVAGQDTGYAWRHPAIQKQYRGFLGLGTNHNYNWHDAIHQHGSGKSSCPLNSAEPCDDHGHGTHTMGTMLGDDGAGNRIGVAPDAKWIGCRNMEDGMGTAASYMECFEFFLAPYPIGGNPQKDGRPELAPHVINNSWACPTSEGCKGDEFLRSVRALKAAGIMVVAAIGNEGPGCGSAGDPPGNYTGELISVAAYDHRNGQAASFSSRGPSTWNGGMGAILSAPGSMIRSAVPSGGVGDGLYDYKSGTSMASPHVAGVVALLWGAHPELVGKVQETIELLQRTAVGKTSSESCGNFPGSKVPNAVFGYGFADAYRAVK